ncbi:TcdA/TcdB pore-forming domain-containing protein [Shewanella sp. S23-S33]|uniref:TcdA/TcdB pore-forming domain-containing protein n=1 Tax=Shewanella sp. S23-S33 TaxID=3342769 RepID=UPI00372CE79F
MKKTFLSVLMTPLLTAQLAFGSDSDAITSDMSNDFGSKKNSIGSVALPVQGISKMGKMRLQHVLMASSAQAMTDFVADPHSFLTQHTVDVIELIKHGTLPEQGFAKLTSSISGYQLHFSAVAGSDTAPAYFLGFNGRGNPVPAYVDIPKLALEGSFLLTGLLTGSSVIVTELNATHYRVFHDGRVGSSVLYDNVVMSVDYDDYQGAALDNQVAAAYMLFKDGRWQMMLQLQVQKIVLGEAAGVKWLKREGNEGKPYIQTPGSVSNNQIESQFANKRLMAQTKLLKNAVELRVELAQPPSDQPIHPEEPLKVDENSALIQWQVLRNQLNQAVEEELRPLRERKTDLLSKLKHANRESEKQYLAELNAIKVTEAFYQDRYELNIKRSIDMDRMWLWLDKKQRNGTQSVIAIDSQLAGGGNLRLVERYNNFKTALNNLSGERGLSYQQGFAHSADVEIPGWQVDMTTLQMMGLLLDESKELTYQHKGALVARIKDNYKQEVYRNALDKTQQVATYIRSQGGEVAQLMPQDFILLAQPGRCLPLSRMMASAIASKGPEGIREFALNLYGAAANPEDVSSKHIYQTIGYLHSNTDAGLAETRLGKWRISQIVSELQAESLGANGAVLMLMNTTEHTMLVGKTTTAEKEVFYFYDPNFAVFSFDNAAAFSKGLNEHLIKKSYARFYSAYGDNKHLPEFEMRRVNTTAMAQIRLSSGLSVSDIISPNDRVANLVVHQTAAAIGQTKDSLEADLKLKSGLTLLESVNLAEDFFTATEKLFKLEGLDHNWFPVFENITDKGDGSYRIPVINRKNPEQVRELITRDERILAFKRHYENALDTIKTRYTYSDGVLLPRYGVAEVEHVDGLNSAFAVQSIITWFQNKSRSSATGGNLSKGLGQALAVHTYINLAQIAHGTILDAAKIVKLYQVAIHQGEAVTSATLSAVSHTVNEGIGIGLGFASVVLDSYELGHAQNEVQRAIYGTQLAFDSASVISSAAGIGAGLLGGSTAGAVLGGAGVITGGLAIGFTALAQAFGEVTEDAKAVGKYFAAVDSAYQHGGYVKVDKILADGTNYHGIEPRDGAVITELDFNSNLLKFDSQYIYRTHHGVTGSGKINYFFWAGDMPREIRDKSQAINVRAGIGYTDTADFHPENRVLVLPATPKSYISYDYQNLPGSTTRHDSGFDVIRRLESDYRFDYDFYIFPSEYIIRKITQEYVHTPIRINLDDQNRQIQMRQLGPELQGKLSYQFSGRRGEYHIVLQTGAELSLEVTSRQVRGTRWVLDARHLNSDQIIVQQDHISVGGVRVNLASLTLGSITVLNKRNEVFYINMEELKAELISEDGRAWDSSLALQTHLHSLAKDQHLESQFVAVDNFQPQKGSFVGQAFYQVSENRFIYTNNPAKSEFLAQARLISIKQNKAWFSNRAELWQVDIVTGQVLKQYRPLRFWGEQTQPENSRAWEEGEHLYFAIEQIQGADQRVTWTYRVDDDQLKLMAVQGDMDLIAAVDNPNVTNLIDIAQIFPDLDQWLITTEDLEPLTWVNAELDQLITLSAKQGELNKRYWIRPGNLGLHGVIRANVDTKIPADLMLAFVTPTQNPSQSAFYFYSHSEQSLYFQADNGRLGTQAVKVDISSLKSVFTNNSQLFAQRLDGSVFVLDNSGTARLAGVNSDWLKVHRTSLLSSLQQLSMQNDLKLENLALLGLKDTDSQVINAWFDVKQQRLVMGGANLENHTLSYLGLSQDEKYAWIFDVSERALYKQLLATPSASLQLNDMLEITVNVEEAERYQQLGQGIVRAERQRNHLQLTTPEGLVFNLSYHAELLDEPTLVAVTAHWREEHQSDLNGSLAFLDYPMATAVKLQGQAVTAPAWYLSQSKQVISSNALNAAHYLEYLGQDNADENSYFVHDKTTNQLLRVSGESADLIGDYGFVQLEQASVLVLQADKNHRQAQLNVPHIAGVTSVMISAEAEGQTYVFTSADLAHYHQIVIDNHAHKALLQLEVSDVNSILVQKRDGDLVLYDIRSETGIIIRNIDEASSRKLKLVISGRTVSCYALLEKMKYLKTKDNQVINLRDLMAPGEF